MIICVLILGLLGIRSFIQTNHWKNNLLFYIHTIKINPNFAEAHNNIGGIFYNQGKYDRAIYYFYETLKLNPGNISAKENSRLTLRTKGLSRQYISDYFKSLHNKNK